MSTAMMAAKTRTVLDLNTKVKVIHASTRDRLSVKQIVQLFNVGKTQIYEILKKKDDVLRQWETCGNGKRKVEGRKSANEDINTIVGEWYLSVKAENHYVSGPMVQRYAKQVAQQLGKADFKASNGWLESFRKRNQITFNELCGETVDVSTKIFEEWITKLRSLVEGYKPENIANGDETELYFRALPNKSQHVKKDKSPGRKLLKEKITIFLCGFMSGEIDKPLVIGKAAKPQCFKNIDMLKLPVIWRSNEKALMTCQIMEEWLRAFNSRMKNQNRHILLFLNHTAFHPDIELSNVQLVWFPPDITSMFQPMNQGIIQNFEVYYRNCLMQSLLANMNSASSAPALAKTVSVLDAVIWINYAVKQLLPETVTKCFRKAGFPSREINASSGFPNDVQDLQNRMQVASRDFSDEEYVNVDENIQIEPDMAYINALIENFRGSEKEVKEEKCDENEREKSDEEEREKGDDEEEREKGDEREREKSDEKELENGDEEEREKDDEEEVDAVSLEKEQCRVKTYTDVVKTLKELQHFALHHNDSDMFRMISEAKLFAEGQAAKEQCTSLEQGVLCEETHTADQKREKIFDE